MSDADFSLERPFDVDDGQLDGLTPARCFTLGYELALVDAAIKAGTAFSMMVHADNQSRIERELDKKDREYKFVWTADDSSESWVELLVAPSPGASDEPRE